MKKLLLFIVLFLSINVLSAQVVDSLRIHVPIMDYAFIDTITDTITGEMIFCTDCSSTASGTLVIFNRGNWETLEGTSLNIPSTPTLDTIITSLTSIVWDWNLDTTVTGYKWNITNTYSTATDMDTVHTRTETSLTCNTVYTRYVWAYNTYGHSSVLTMSDTTTDCWTCDSVTVIHLADLIAPVADTITYYGVTGILGETTKCWTTQNLGATTQPSAYNDTAVASLGWYFQFNSKRGYQWEDSVRTPSSTWTSSITSNSSWLTANDPCAIELGTGWRIPTSTEWYNIDKENEWVNNDSVYNDTLYLHAAGRLTNTTGAMNYRGSNGYYWSSTQASSTQGKIFYFTSSAANITSYYKTAACSIRCIHN